MSRLRTFRLLSLPKASGISPDCEQREERLYVFRRVFSVMNHCRFPRKGARGAEIPQQAGNRAYIPVSELSLTSSSTSASRLAKASRVHSACTNETRVRPWGFALGSEKDACTQNPTWRVARRTGTFRCTRLVLFLGAQNGHHCLRGNVPKLRG